MCLFLFGFAKAAIMPLHNWLPSAMVAPTPVSALLHAVAVVKAGVFCISRVMLSTFGLELLRTLILDFTRRTLSPFTILVASIIALTKDDLKARLAYSTVSQLSYIVLGVALLDPSGVTGGILHIVNHGFSKITLFFCAGAIYRGHPKEKDKRHGRDRLCHALHHGRICHGVPEYDRRAAGGRLCDKMVSPERSLRDS